ncbi:hypothetical protein SAMN06295879_1896 [Agreia bicolorata]|uniref:Uncharacterized protein n=1 Tax=Agreia bicolorata TaxID=110935 RepID=A0A1T4XX28_9MICO|nr:hypothetical protein SAMN06295879_1896 [Agreia bicolorata]
MTANTKCCPRERAVVRILHRVAVALFAGGLIYAGIITLANSTVESAQDAAGIRSSIEICAALVTASIILAIAAFLVLHPSFRDKPQRRRR